MGKYSESYFSDNDGFWEWFYKTVIVCYYLSYVMAIMGIFGLWLGKEISQLWPFYVVVGIDLFIKLIRYIIREIKKEKANS